MLLGNAKNGLAFVVSAPAGTGKTTLVEKLAQEFPSVIKNISFTTRKPRKGEVDGVDYHFIDEKEFEKKIAQGEFLEYVKLFGDYYGSSRNWIEQQLKKGKHVFLVIDTQGAMQIKGKFPAIFIFLKPPSLEVLKERLEKRSTESLSEQEERFALAAHELEVALHYDYNVVNEDLETAYQVLRSITIAEEHKVRGKNHGTK